MRNTDPDFHGHDLACAPYLRVVGRVVGELEAFAEPEVAGRGRVRGQEELGEAFDVRGVVAVYRAGDGGAAEGG